MLHGTFPIMLLYRPLLSAYRQTSVASARRYLLREFADPQLHAEPDELLRELERNKDVGLLDEPARLNAEVALRERLLKLRLTTRDPARAQGGMWTMHSASKTLQRFVTQELQLPRLVRAAGQWIGSPAEALTRTVPGDERVRVLCSLGDMGSEVAFETLKDELVSGPMAAAAAIGLSRLPDDEGHVALLPAVQARGLGQCGAWLGTALSRMPSHTTTPLLTRLATSDDKNLREQAAWAVGSYAQQNPRELISMFNGEKEPFVRLHLLGSMGRLGVPGGLALLKKFTLPNDPVMLKTAAIKAAGKAPEAEARAYLAEALKSKEPEEVAEALQALVGMGIPGEPFLEVARQAAASRHGRLMLVGLLALSIWAPDEAFARVRDTFAQPPSSQWFLAAYVLRYLKTDQTVPLLAKLCTAAHGSDLEEITVSSLCRYLEDPAALHALFTLAKAGTAPLVLNRMMLDIARHLPPRHTGEAAKTIRELLKHELDPSLAGPMLVALGSLGDSDDLPTLYGFLNGPAAVAAIHAIELIGEKGAAAELDRLAKGPTSPAAEAAVVALFRLGERSSAQHFERLCGAGDDTPSAARCFTEMAVSVRCIKETSRLQPLYDTLAEIAKDLPPSAAEAAAAAPAAAKAGANAGAEPGDVDLVSEAMRAAEEAAKPRDLESQLQARRKTMRNVKPLAINQQAPTGSGSAVYRDLGKHLKDVEPDDEARARRTQKQVLAGLFIALVVISGFAYWRHRTSTAQAPDVAEAARLAAFPPLYRFGGDPDAGVVKSGETVTGQRKEPARLMNRVPENQIAATGRLRVDDVSFPDRLPLESHVVLGLLDNSVEVRWPRGTARIVIEGARTTVDVKNGHVRIDMKESTFLLYAIAGEIKTLRGTTVMKTIQPGQGGEFLEGNTIGRLEDATPPPPLLPPAPQPAGAPSPSPAN